MQMDDPLTALMHAVQVMNFLKTLIEKTLREREDSILDSALASSSRDPSGENDHLYPLQTILEESNEHDDNEGQHSKSSHPAADDNFPTNAEAAQGDDSLTAEVKEDEISRAKSKVTKPSTARKGSRKTNERLVAPVTKSTGKTKGASLVSSVNLRTERTEAWR